MELSTFSSSFCVVGFVRSKKFWRGKVLKKRLLIESNDSNSLDFLREFRSSRGEIKSRNL